MFELSNKAPNDGARYFGPFGGRYVTQHMLDTLRLAMKLPRCSKRFPRDLGKERPCLSYHMGHCDAWCQLSRDPAEYRARTQQMVLMLEGKYQDVAADNPRTDGDRGRALEFEQAAVLRDRLKAVESLSQKQLVTAGTMANTDVIGYYQSEAKACFAVLHFVDGNLLDKDYEILTPSETPEETVSSLVKQYYLTRCGAPKQIFLPCEMEDAELFAELLQQNLGKKVRINRPQRGDNVKLVELANKNAREEAERVTNKQERQHGALRLLEGMLGRSEPLHRLESYDISHIAARTSWPRWWCSATVRRQKRTISASNWRTCRIRTITPRCGRCSRGGCGILRRVTPDFRKSQTPC